MRNFELRQALVTTLKAHAPLAALLAPDVYNSADPAVYDHVPQEAPFPYIAIGDFEGTEHDADDITGQDLEVTIHAWSRYRGRKEIEEIGREVDAALHRQKPVVTDASIVTMHRTNFDAILDDDGLTRHGLQRFRVILQEE